MPNILLSHNPNTFNRAAELGIELSLAGHTHGGQIQVEILDHRLTPARFISDYIAGLFERPLYKPSEEVLVRREPDVLVEPASPIRSALRQSRSWHGRSAGSSRRPSGNFPDRAAPGLIVRVPIAYPL